MSITENQRIFFNILFTYGRSLLSILAGIFISRWILLSLGHTDYGLFGLIGGMIIFIQFLNDSCASVTARFYAFSIGEAKKDIKQGLENCRKWFNTALTIHTLLPLFLIIIGYPIGKWAIFNWLTIPPDRIQSCLWVWRFTCFSSFIAMINVPFTAMYTAKQYIAELTIYSMATTILNVIFAYFMVTHPGEWLTKYALWMCAMSVVPQIIICIRANYIFKECKLNWSYMLDKSCLKQISSFATWQFFSTFCWVLRTQGISLLINKAFGPKINSSMNIANQINSKTSSLSSALIRAFTPAITSACGEKNYARMNKLSINACKFGTLMSLIFVIPLMLELSTILHIWLKNPPPFTYGLCQLILIYYLCQMCTTGYFIAINATGKIKEYYIILSSISIFVLPISILSVYLGGGVYSIGFVLIISNIINSIGRIYFAKKLLNISAVRWIKEVLLPILLIIILCGTIGYLPHLCMQTGILRIIITTIVVEVVLFPFSWFFVLNSEERMFVYSKIKNAIVKF